MLSKFFGSSNILQQCQLNISVFISHLYLIILTLFFIYIYLYILFLIKFFEREREREIVEVHYIADFIVLFLQCLIIKPSVISWESSTGKYKGKYHICCSICAKNAMNCLSL